MIRYVTGNLDQNDLKEINSNLHSLFQNQGNIIKQMDKFTSFANHVTERYSKDMLIIQENINTSLSAFSTLNSKVENLILIQYNIHLANRLLNIIHDIQRTISLAFNEITNMEIMTTEELREIISHLNIIYKKDELLNLDSVHLFKILEFSKYKIFSIHNIITCILYIPILNSSPYNYQKIYPIPNFQHKILFPPQRHRLQGANGEYWTQEDCPSFGNQTLCQSPLETNKCSLEHLHKCNFMLATNNYKIIKRLNNNKILISTKQPLHVTEICNSIIKREEVVNNVLLSSKNKYCRIIIDKMSYENTFSNHTYYLPKISQTDFTATKSIRLQQQHLEDPISLKEEAEELKKSIDLHPLVHITHLSTTFLILLIFIIIPLILYLCRNKLQEILGKLLPNTQAEITDDSINIPLQQIAPHGTYNLNQNVDVLS